MTSTRAPCTPELYYAHPEVRRPSPSPSCSGNGFCFGAPSVHNTASTRPRCIIWPWEPWPVAGRRNKFPRPRYRMRTRNECIDIDAPVRTASPKPHHRQQRQSITTSQRADTTTATVRRLSSICIWDNCTDGLTDDWSERFPSACTRPRPPHPR